jgi:hypothetical protein
MVLELHVTEWSTSPSGTRQRSVQQLVVPSSSTQLRNGIRYEGPRDDANQVSGLPQVVDMRKSSLKSVGAVVLDHPQRGAPGIDVVQMEHVASLLRDGLTARAYDPH